MPIQYLPPSFHYQSKKLFAFASCYHRPTLRQHPPNSNQTPSPHLVSYHLKKIIHYKVTIEPCTMKKRCGLFPLHSHPTSKGSFRNCIPAIITNGDAGGRNMEETLPHTICL